MALLFKAMKVTWLDRIAIIYNWPETILSVVNRELTFKSQAKINHPLATNNRVIDLTWPNNEG